MKLTDAPVLKFRHFVVDNNEQVDYEKVVAKSLASEIENEKGTLIVLAGVDKSTTQNSYLVECYRDPLSYQEHEVSPQFKDFSETAKKIVSESDNFDLMPQIILMQDDPMNISHNNDLFIQMEKYTLVDGDLEKFGKELQHESDEILINEEDYLGTIAGNFFDVENEWRVFTIFKSKSAYDRHLKSNWHHDFDEKTREMIYSKENIQLKTICFGNQGELIYSK